MGALLMKIEIRYEKINSEWQADIELNNGEYKYIAVTTFDSLLQYINHIACAYLDCF